jgi:hypothetical protein
MEVYRGRSRSRLISLNLEFPEIRESPSARIPPVEPCGFPMTASLPLRGSSRRAPCIAVANTGGESISSQPLSWVLVAGLSGVFALLLLISWRGRAAGILLLVATLINAVWATAAAVEAAWGIRRASSSATKRVPLPGQGR